MPVVAACKDRGGSQLLPTTICTYWNCEKGAKKVRPSSLLSLAFLSSSFIMVVFMSTLKKFFPSLFFGGEKVYY
jgi:hypothetical protein